MKNVVLPIVLIAGLVGCATSPEYKNYTANDAACLKGGGINLFSFNSGDEANVFIKEIDDVPTESDAPYCFTPGKHHLGVSAYRKHQSVHDYIDLEFEAGKTYLLRANLRGISFAFQLIDITSQPEKKVAEFRLKVDAITRPTIVPILVPVR